MIKIAETEEEIRQCFPIMAELRPRFTDETGVCRTSKTASWKITTSAWFFLMTKELKQSAESESANGWLAENIWKSKI